MSSPFLYAGVNPAVWQMLRDGALARGQGEPRQVPRPVDVNPDTLAGVTHVFVDGPALRLQRVLEEVDACGGAQPVIWIASEVERRRAPAALVARAADVWHFTGPALAWTLPGETALPPVPETPILVPGAVGEAEGERVAFVEASAFATAGPDARLQRVTEWARRFFGFPLVLVNLVGRDTLTHTAGAGMPADLAPTVPRDGTLCQFVVAGNQPLVIPDFDRSEVFRDHPLVATKGLQAYVGVPLRNAHQFVLGSLCLLDSQAHPVSLSQIEVLHALAAAAGEALQERRPADGRLQVSPETFHRLGRALARLGREWYEPLSVARLPAAGAAGAWDQDLEVFACDDAGDCLVCLPQTTVEAARARVTAVAAAVGIPESVLTVVGGTGLAWAELLTALQQAVPHAGTAV